MIYNFKLPPLQKGIAWNSYKINAKGTIFTFSCQINTKHCLGWYFLKCHLWENWRYSFSKLYFLFHTFHCQSIISWAELPARGYRLKEGPLYSVLNERRRGRSYGVYGVRYSVCGPHVTLPTVREPCRQLPWPHTTHTWKLRFSWQNPLALRHYHSCLVPDPNPT